jgi:hypothetical protein
VSDHRYYDRPGGNHASAGPGKCIDLEVVIRKNAILIFADPEDDDRYHQRPDGTAIPAMAKP